MQNPSYALIRTELEIGVGEKYVGTNQMGRTLQRKEICMWQLILFSTFGFLKIFGLLKERHTPTMELPQYFNIQTWWKYLEDTLEISFQDVKGRSSKFSVANENQ